MGWELVYYSEDLQRAIMNLPAGIQTRYIHLAQHMISFRPDLGMPHSRAIGRSLVELSMKSKEGIGRAFVSILPHRRIMMLNAFVKKLQKTPATELGIARQRLREV